MANLGEIGGSSTTYIPIPVSTPAYAAPVAAAPVIAPAAVGGFGGGDFLSTALLLGLIGGNGVGRGVGKDCIDQTSLNGMHDSLNTNAILSKLASIEAAVPYNEAQVQLALAGLGDQLTRTITNGHTALTQNQFALQLQEAQSTSAVQAQLAANTATVLSNLNAVDNNVDRNSTAIINTIRDDGNATRALITDNLIHGLRDDKVILANELAELRNERNRDRDRHGVEVTMINNQNQNQLQFQQQAQVLTSLSHGIVDALQSIRATNQAINIGAGTLTSTPTNTNTNVRA